MKKFICGFTSIGKTVMILNCISLILAIVMQKYDGIPFIFFSVLFAIVSLREQQY